MRVRRSRLRVHGQAIEGKKRDSRHSDGDGKSLRHGG
jgi:hypothetical protein